MTVFNLGSINIDHFYRVPHLPQPGETLAATGFSIGLGGKGANQSVAVAQTGAQVVHIGAIGPDGQWTTKKLQMSGVDTDHISVVESPTAHAIINIDEAGENAIVLCPGANGKQSLTKLKKALDGIGASDILMLQNETNLQVEAAELAKSRDAFVVYSAAPFSAPEVEKILPLVDLLVLNDIEAAQLSAALNLEIEDVPVANLLVTKGSEGSIWYDLENECKFETSAFNVDVVDTTGAGDCFVGYVIGGLDTGLEMREALRLGTAASAIMIGRQGTADAIPTRAEVEKFLS